MTRIDAGAFLALCLPNARSQSVLELATELNYLSFAFDDAHVDDPRLRTCAGLAPVIGALMAVLDAPEAPVEDRYERALCD
ncbi:hypothetical protein [Kitasatospora sp. NPDC057500]|uniref:hypothetical protein n=1 Tax=Kitasatospora sp. NPDC057500 TaxID=3346151 RepID=UPI0036B57EAC